MTRSSTRFLVEVLYDSTAAYDRGEKSRHYQSIRSLREYLLIEPSAVRVEHYSLEEVILRERVWRRQDHASVEDVATLPSLGLALPLARIYAGVVPFAPPS